MNKLIIVFLFFGLISCGNKKVEQGQIDQDSVSNDSSTDLIVSGKINYAEAFAANRTTAMGKAINCIFQDRNDNYWFATNSQGVFCYDGETMLQFDTKDNLCSDQVFTIQEDHAGNIWFLTVAGISRFDGKTFTTFPNTDNKQLSNDKNSKAENLWFETAGGAYHYDGHSFTYTLLPPSDLDREKFNSTDPQKPDWRKVNSYTLYCSMKDKEGNVWFGTQSLGVCRYDGKSFTWFSEKGLSPPAVRGLFEDRNGNIWFGNNGGGLFRYDGKTLTNVTEEKGLANHEFVTIGIAKQGTLARVWTINEDNSGNLWIGTTDCGVWRYDGKDFTNYTTEDGLTSNAINTIYKDKNGELWFGTDGEGVCKFNGKTFSIFTVQP